MDSRRCNDLQILPKQSAGIEVPDSPDRLRHSAYSPEGLKEYLAHKADVERRVAAGHLSE
ncbi:MAG TPA: hypothetical protein VJP76_01875 [Candidatus Tumulicola sp.]|nr:hypothetical protein [Candidatus Tumulicola sp.]